MDFSDFYGIISEVVVDDEREIVTLCEESEHFPVVIQELLLGYDSASSKGLLQEFLHLRIFLSRHLDLRLVEIVCWCVYGRRLGLSMALSTVILLNWGLPRRTLVCTDRSQ